MQLEMPPSPLKFLCAHSRTLPKPRVGCLHKLSRGTRRNLGRHALQDGSVRVLGELAQCCDSQVGHQKQR
eukprot:5609013-Amphidinium_carterae.1